jgi:P-type E1-E2 ATPase
MLVGLLVSLALAVYRDGLGDPLALVIIVVGATGLVHDTIAAVRETPLRARLPGAPGDCCRGSSVGVSGRCRDRLMLESGRALEEYGVRRARSSLSMLSDRIPRTALVLREGEAPVAAEVDEIELGSEVLLRHGEVLLLDGELLSERALVDESSLSGEPYLLDKVHSGTVNQGPPLRLRVLREARDSTYSQILALVESALEGSAPVARLADRYSLVFSAVAIALATGAWWYSGSLDRALAVLVVATPCPLILGVPIALMGGVNRAARDKIIVKRLAGLEVLAKLTFLMLDKPGTITVGRPELVRIESVPDGHLTDYELLSLTAAVERHSLHPIAKSLVEAAQARSLPLLEVADVQETAGQGISASVGTRTVLVHGAPAPYGQMHVACEVDGQFAGTFVLEDRLKPDARMIFQKILRLGVQLPIATGDRRAAAEHAVQGLGLPLEIDAECTPAFKLELIRRRQVWQALWIARQTIRVATQGILLGIGLSVLAMLFAAAGYLPPLAGALLQEGIECARDRQRPACDTRPSNRRDSRSKAAK